MPTDPNEEAQKALEEWQKAQDEETEGEGNPSAEAQFKLRDRADKWLKDKKGK